MFINSLTIKNYRSINELTLEPKNLCALIGPNSSGKTNLLKALDLVIGEGWTTKAKVARELFHDISEKIFIKVDFLDSISWSYYSQEKSISSVTLEMTYEPLKCDVRLWEDYPNDRNGDGYYINEDFKKSCHFIFIPSERNLSSELRVS